VAEASLDELASKHIIQLSVKTNELIQAASSDAPVVPSVDPATLKALILDYLRAVRARERMRKRFEKLTWVGPAGIVAMALTGIGSVLGFGGMSSLLSSGVAPVGWVLLTIGIALAIVVFVVYAYLQHVLGSAELLSKGNE
jgi:uncharacterized membrane protein YedE/YeeE